MAGITDLEDLLPLVDGAETAEAFGAAVIAAGVERGHKWRLALAARDALGLPWSDNGVARWLKPSAHTEAARAKRSEAFRKASREYRRRERTEAPEKNRDNARRWRRNNPGAARDAQARRRARDPEAVVEYQRAWRENNRDRVNERQNRRRVDEPAVAVRAAVACRVYNALKAALAGKAHGTTELLGCSATEYVAYLEGLFEPGMDCGNWAMDGWHIDHVRPVASFDLTDPAQQREAFHFTNTRPMWAADNLAKGSLYQGERHRHGS